MQSVRARLEGYEAQNLAPYSTKSSETKGRVYPERESDYQTAFQHDRQRIMGTAAFRRLGYKTHCFGPEQDYYRTCLTHTLEAIRYG